MLVPLCAKILSHIGDELYLTIFGETFIITMALPFSWKAFFYASVAFSAASLGYAISCPAIVRDCESFSGFVEQGKGATQIIEAFQSYLWPLRRDWAVNEFLSTFCKVEKDTRKKTVYVDSPISSISTMKEKRIRAELAVAEILPEKIGDAFWYVRDLSDKKGIVARVLCTVLYFVGFTLLAFIFLQNILYVANYA